MEKILGFLLGLLGFLVMVFAIFSLSIFVLAAMQSVEIENDQEIFQANVVCEDEGGVDSLVFDITIWLSHEYKVNCKNGAAFRFIGGVE